MLKKPKLSTRAAALEAVLTELRKVKGTYTYNGCFPPNDPFVKGCHYGFDDGLDRAIKTVECMAFENAMEEARKINRGTKKK